MTETDQIAEIDPTIYCKYHGRPQLIAGPVMETGLSLYLFVFTSL